MSMQIKCFFLLGIKVKELRTWMPLMKISLGLLQLIELLICFVQDEVIFCALHISEFIER